MKGLVAFWKSKSGYGFIKGEDGVSYFVHASRLTEDFICGDRMKNLDVGETVYFDPVPGKKDPMASDVRAEP